MNKSISTPVTVRPCADCGADLWMQSKHYFFDKDDSYAVCCLPCGKLREDGPTIFGEQ